ncbi:MAG: metal-sensing transcriptional repressor [Thomasclavelia sp.]|jgi:DNA-binding FrmR family transcriptional regulator|nr:metal-sensing transcriptional repressor [Thomasclavelia sp.]
MKHKIRTNDEKKKMVQRLNRIEGQVRGISNMVQEDRYCVDIFNQVLAIQKSLNSFNKVLLANHINTCVVEDIKNDNTEAVDELCSLIQKLMK